MFFYFVLLQKIVHDSRQRENVKEIHENIF